MIKISPQAYKHHTLFIPKKHLYSNHFVPGVLMPEKMGLGAYRPLLAIPIVMLLLASGLLAYGYTQTGEWFQRSIDLKGGTLLSIRTDSPHDPGLIESGLSRHFGQVVVRELRSFSGFGLTVQVDSGVDADDVKSRLEALGIDTGDTSVETIGPTLGESFWLQAQASLVAAFILMGIIVFVIFRSFVPSTAVILAAVSDIIVTLALMQLISIEMSLASLAALLMLIGYSIDTDILLTTRVIRTQEDSVSSRTRGAFKTGMTMTLTTIGVLAAIVVTTTSAVLFTIASVLLLGLAVDIVNTWLMNATIIRWYAERKGL
jgi:preprotein translocase subunit SecF